MPPTKPEPKLKSQEEMQAEINRRVEEHINMLAKEKGIDPLLVKIHLIDFLSGKK